MGEDPEFSRVASGTEVFYTPGALGTHPVDSIDGAGAKIPDKELRACIRLW